MTTELRTIFADEHDDLFLCAGSFEPRCTYIPSLMAKSDYRVDRSELIRFSRRDERKEKNIASIINFMFKVSTIRPRTTTFDIETVSDFSDSLSQICEEMKSARAITIDITTFTKKYLLIMLSVLRKKIPAAVLRLLYTPGKYMSSSHLSWGVRSISAVPFFGGMSAIESGKKLLVLFLGYERERAWAIMNHVEPDNVVAVIAHPPVHEGDDIPALKANNELIERASAEKRYVSALKPSDTVELLTELYKSPLYKDHMFYVSPLGPKMETVGIYLFFETNHPADRAQVIYASPVIYNSAKYTVDYDINIVEYIMPVYTDK